MVIDLSIEYGLLVAGLVMHGSNMVIFGEGTPLTGPNTWKINPHKSLARCTHKALHVLQRSRTIHRKRFLNI